MLKKPINILMFRPTSYDFAFFFPKSLNTGVEKNNVVGEIFNAGSENWFESNIKSRQTQTSPESHGPKNVNCFQ